MPRFQKTSLNKSAEIRQGLSQHPDKGPAEIARLLTQQLGVTIRPKDVSTIKAKVRLKVGQAAQPQPAPAAARQTPAPIPPASRAGGVSEVVTTLQNYIRQLGKEDLHRLIDTL